MAETFEFTDRYGGGPGPDVETMCKGQCEGMGCVPIYADDPDDPWRTLWIEAYTEAGEHECDGVHFVRCPECGGTGKRLAGSNG